MERKKQIVFLESFSTSMIYNIAKMFKKSGYEIILIRLLKPNKSNIESYNKIYDKVIDMNLSYIQISLKNMQKIIFLLSKNFFSLIKSSIKIIRLKPYLVIGRAAPSWPVAIYKIIFPNRPLIYFPYDIRTFVYPTKMDAKRFGGLSDFEINCERFCFEHCDGLLHKYDPNALKFIQGRMIGNDIRLPEFQLSFLPYCIKDSIVPLNKNKLSKKDHETHICYPGSIGVKKDIYIDFFEVFREILKQKIHVHIFAQINTDSEEKPDKDLLYKKYNGCPELKYFHIETPTGPDVLSKELSKYDYGIFIPPHKTEYYNIDPLYTMGYKFANFYEAGIPSLCSPHDKFIYQIYEKHKTALPLTDEGFNSIKNLHKRLKKVDYKKYEKNILLARKDFSFEKNFPELERFSKKVADRKRKIPKFPNLWALGFPIFL